MSATLKTQDAAAEGRTPAATATERAAGAEPSDRTLRIGELAELTGVTPRTIRYYEEIGLLGGGAERSSGQHRCYTAGDVERLGEIVRLRDLLGLSLEQLSQLVEAESARATLRREYRQTESPAQRRRILEELRKHIGTQLHLVSGRLSELEQLRNELESKQALVEQRLRENS